MSYTLTVEADPEDEENFLLTFPDQLLAELNWKPGDTLNWDVQEDGTITLTTVKNDIQQS